MLTDSSAATPGSAASAIRSVAVPAPAPVRFSSDSPPVEMVSAASPAAEKV